LTAVTAAIGSPLVRTHWGKEQRPQLTLEEAAIDDWPVKRDIEVMKNR